MIFIVREARLKVKITKHILIKKS